MHFQKLYIVLTTGILLRHANRLQTSGGVFSVLVCVACMSLACSMVCNEK